MHTALNTCFGVALKDVLFFIGVECFYLSREASRFAQNFDLEKRHYGLIQQISIFSEIYRFSTKRSIQ